MKKDTKKFVRTNCEGNKVHDRPSCKRFMEGRIRHMNGNVYRIRNSEGRITKHFSFFNWRLLD